MIKPILFTIIIFANFCIAQNFGSMKFTNYADDRQSAFSLTFDDGLKTHYDYAKPVLDEYGFKGTFYVLPPYLAEDNQDLIWRYGRWSEFQQMAAEGNEIGSHTMNHYDLTSLEWGSINSVGTLLYELYQSKLFIEQKIPTKKCISFNYPYTIHNSEIDSAAKLFYEDARALGQSPNNSSLTEDQLFALKATVIEFDLPRNSLSDDLDELYTFLSWTQNSINNHKWAMIIIHDVIPSNQLGALVDSIYEPITTEWFTSLCDFLWDRSTNNKIWVETVGNITRYIKERENSNYQIISSSNQLIEINVTDNLNDEIFNYPLSAYVKIPNDWYYVRAEQNGKVDTLTTTLTDSGRVALVNVIPDKGIFKISPIITTLVENKTGTVSGFELYQNYPNPFNPTTKIRYSIPTSPLNPSPYQGEGPGVRFVTLKVYDILGNEIATLVNDEQPAGNYEVGFDAASSIKNPASGLYFYRLQAGEFVQTRKMILLK